MREVALHAVLQQAESVSALRCAAPRLVGRFGIVAGHVDETTVGRPGGIGRVAGTVLNPLDLTARNRNDADLEDVAFQPLEGDARTVGRKDRIRANGYGMFGSVVLVFTRTATGDGRQDKCAQERRRENERGDWAFSLHATPLADNHHKTLGRILPLPCARGVPADIVDVERSTVR